MGFLARLLRNSSLHEGDGASLVEQQAAALPATAAMAVDGAEASAAAPPPAGQPRGGKTTTVTGKRPPPESDDGDAAASDADGASSSSESEDEEAGNLFALPPGDAALPPRRRAAIDFTDTGSGASSSTAANTTASGAATNPLDAFTDLALVHRGRNAYVYRARERAAGGRRVVLKCYPCGGAGGRGRPRQQALERELALMKLAAAAAPGAAVALERSFDNADGAWLVLEACTGGTLMKAIANAGGKLPEARVASRIAAPLLRALAALHALGVVHRDVKPEHVLFAPACDGGGLRLADFAQGARAPPRAALVASADATAATSTAAAPAAAPPVTPSPGRRVSRDGHRRSSKESRRLSADAPGSAGALVPPPPPPPPPHAPNHPFAAAAAADDDPNAPPCVDALNHRIGSVEYMAPEVLSTPSAAEVFHLVLSRGMDEGELPTYDDRADVWSLGVLVYEALTGVQPFLADSAADMAAAIGARMAARCEDGDGTTPEFIARLAGAGVSADGRAFIAAALSHDVRARPSAAALLSHPWLVRAAAAAAAHTGGDSAVPRRSLSEAMLEGVDVRPGVYTRGRTQRVSSANPVVPPTHASGGV